MKQNNRHLPLSPVSIIIIIIILYHRGKSQTQEAPNGGKEEECSISWQGIEASSLINIVAKGKMLTRD